MNRFRQQENKEMKHKLNVEEAKAKQRTSDVDEGLKKGGREGFTWTER